MRGDKARAAREEVRYRLTARRYLAEAAAVAEELDQIENAYVSQGRAFPADSRREIEGRLRAKSHLYASMIGVAGDDPSVAADIAETRSVMKRVALRSCKKAGR